MMPSARPISFDPRLRPASVHQPFSSSNAPSTLGFGMTKGGSTLLFELLEEAAKTVGLTYMSVEDVLFSQGDVASDRPNEIDMSFESTGYCYGGFRAFPTYQVPIIDESKTVWLVRDPRDALVSLYYSVAYSHPAPGGAAGERFLNARRNVRELGLQAFAVRRFMQQMRVIDSYYAQSFSTRPNVRVYRYEDVISRKHDWLADMCEWFGWKLTDSEIEGITAPRDIFPAQEDHNLHVRRVRPGAYLEELNPKVIKRLDNLFAEFLEDFDYPTGLLGNRLDKAGELE